MRLHEVGRNQFSSTMELARAVIYAWEHQQSNRLITLWLNQLSSDERLLNRLYRASKRYKIYGNDDNEPFLDSSAICARAYNILVNVESHN
jgi:carbohydrate-selective porin OprB